MKYDGKIMGVNERKKNSSSAFKGMTGVAALTILCTLATFGKRYMDSTNLKSYMHATNELKAESFDERISILQERLGYYADSDEINDFYMLYSIYSNPNMSDSEKEVFYNFYDIIRDIEYIDREEAYKSLNTLRIIYGNRNEYVKESVLGEYASIIETISIYDDDSDKHVLIHEGIHSIFNNEKTRNIPVSFSEGMTELLANEYFSSDPFYEGNNYPYEIAYVKMLCDMVGSNMVARAYCTGDFSIITDYLDQYYKGKFDSCSILFDYLEDSCSATSNGTERRYDEITDDLILDELDNLYRRVNPNSREIVDFTYNLGLCATSFSKTPAKAYGDYISFYGVLEKSYFNSRLMDKYSTGEIVRYSNRDNVLVKHKLDR